MSEPMVWSRRRLLTALAAVVVAVVLLGAGLVYALVGARGSDDQAAKAPTPSTANAAGDQSAELRRDVIAAMPMQATEPADAKPGRAATVAPATVTVPGATATDPLGIPTGFPRTEQGALGQLAAIGSTVLGHMSVDFAGDVYEAWSQPGGVGVDEWRLTRDVATFTGTAGPQAMLVAVPAAGQVKGSDGSDWLVGCVLFELTAFTTTGATGVEPPRLAYGYCERLAWDSNRWVIAPGAAPAEPPHTWPGTDVAVEAGWRTWVPAAGEQ